MKKFLTMGKPLFLHFCGYVAAAFVASLMANWLLENWMMNSYPVSTSNATYAVREGFNLILIAFSFVLLNLWLNNGNSGLANFREPKVLVTLLVGVTSILVVLLLLYALGLYQVVSFSENSEVSVVFIALFAQAFSQEVLFRGILYGQLSKHINPIKLAVVFSLLLACLNILLDGPHIQPFVATFLLHFILCLLYHISANLWLPIVAYTSWLYITFTTGVLDEHWRVSALAETQTSGSVWLSGGSFGPDASIFGLVMLSCAAFYLYKQSRLVKFN